MCIILMHSTASTWKTGQSDNSALRAIAGRTLSKAECGAPCADAGAGARIGIARLECKAMLAFSREMDDMLTCSTRDFEDKPALRQVACQHLENRLPVTGYRMGIKTSFAVVWHTPPIASLYVS